MSGDEGQTGGACICLAAAQKRLAFHTTPLGSLARPRPEVYEKQRQREETRKERIEEEEEEEKKNGRDDMRRQKER